MWLEQWGDTDPLVFYVFCGVAGLISVLSFVTLVMVCCCKKKYIPGSAVDFMIVFGGLMITASVLLRGLNPEWTSEEMFEDVCEVYVAPLVFGLVYLFGGFLVKACAIFHYHKHFNGYKARSVEWKPIGWLCALILLDAVFVLVWCILFTMELTVVDEGEKTLYMCDGKNSYEWTLTMSVIHAVLLLLAAIMVWPALHVSRKRISFVESQYTLVIVYNAFFATIAGTLFYFFYESETAMTVQYAVIGGLELYVVLFTVMALLISNN